jgi:hypothetical protein
MILLEGETPSSRHCKATSQAIRGEHAKDVRASGGSTESRQKNKAR